MYIIICCLAALLGMAFSIAVGAFSILGGQSFATAVIAALVVAHLSAICLVIFKVERGHFGLASGVLLAPAFVVPAAAFVISIVLALWRYFAPDSTRYAACTKTGVEFTSPPTTPVSTVHVDWDPSDPFGDLMKSYSVDSGGHLGAIDHEVPAPELLVDSPLADVLITHEVSNRDEAQNGFRLRGLIVYTLIASDQRDGRHLGTMKFAVDIVKARACGANVPNKIDIDAFIHRVVAIPGRSPPPAPDVATIDVNLDTLEGQDYLLLDRDDPREIAMNRKGLAVCEAMLPKVGPSHRRFAADPTGTRSWTTPLLIRTQCDSGGILQLDWFPKQQESLIAKYSPGGDLLYKMRITSPKRREKDHGGIDDSTMSSAGGYLTLIWWDQKPRRDGSPIHGTRLRVKEPN
jgi:hypothetical protein